MLVPLLVLVPVLVARHRSSILDVSGGVRSNDDDATHEDEDEDEHEHEHEHG